MHQFSKVKKPFNPQLVHSISLLTSFGKIVNKEVSIYSGNCGYPLNSFKN